MADWYLKYKRTLNSFGAILLDSTLKKVQISLSLSCVHSGGALTTRPLVRL